MTVDLIPAGWLRRTAARIQRKFRTLFTPDSASGSAVESAYARWAPIYDWVFTAPLVYGQRAAAREANRLSGTLLEVGVGTGLSLPLYSRKLTVTGIDLSEPMLERARQRVAREHLGNVAELQAMDASDLTYGEASFDLATVMYVMTVVPDPASVLAELERVVRPGGTVIIVNHFASERGVLAFAERLLARFSQTLGWDPLFRRERILEHTSMTLEHEERLGPLGLFTMMVFRRP
ncbi:class I SAM-dependent methyltransferase [Stappia indica]|uniref:class I SAM-dependent methyltransferase n=1 Tax=Stappia indica TaxID=538381 RepID=UPI001CD25590|nr:class I SAM-dependent methyltransferase [Stappia indica]MCA1299336.1 class I SAM-dependent methyltransferase [Stappia indica]